ncbi:MAG: hypothetical protein EAY72_12815 [Bacteroidetes bacterium]|nr:MAG: hypothetical protein EAY72_12815 [Bacteroidota bacterium]TAE69615.1 MAG: hypothetical protein EAY68_03475 [Bacteroidota bacterium]
MFEIKANTRCKQKQNCYFLGANLEANATKQIPVLNTMRPSVPCMNQFFPANFSKPASMQIHNPAAVKHKATTETNIHFARALIQHYL